MIISILIFVSSLVFGVISILRGISMRSNASYNDSAAKNAGSKKITIGIASAIIGLVLSFIQPFSLERIDAGNKGLKVNLTGSDRGVSSYQYKTGWVFYN